MMDAPVTLEEQLTALDVVPGTAACVWLGQGGYLFKSSEKVTIPRWRSLQQIVQDNDPFHSIRQRLKCCV